MNRSNKDVSKFRLDGQAALVTGSTRGIGWAIARGMAESGSTVYVNGRDKKVLAARCKNLIDLGYDAKPAFFDATNIEAINRFLDYTEAPIDILVNNAGYALPDHFHKTPMEDEENFLRVLSTAVISLTKNFLPNMIKERTGNIMIVSSVAAYAPPSKIQSLYGPNRAVQRLNF